jgi:uncharacterized membrane-anchored protein YitT (DUF2179 family)
VEILLAVVAVLVAIPVMLIAALLIGKVFTRLTFKPGEDLTGKTPDPEQWWLGGGGGG